MAAAAGGEYSIFVKTLTGSNSEVRVRSTDSVGSLKSKIEQQLKLTLPIVRLVHDSKPLTDDAQTLGDYGVGKEAIVVVVLQSSKPSHYFFALDESGSMMGGRWNELIRSFQDFVSMRHESAAKNGEKLHDLVSVFFHQTHCRLATYVDAAGKQRPFDSIPLVDVTPSSLVNHFGSGGNNFDHALRFLEPYLSKSTDYKPVLMFMTDGGDCGDDAPPSRDFRQRAYDRMAAIKKALPELQVFVTVVYTTSQEDIEGGKQLCRAAGSDIDTCFTYLPDSNSTQHFMPSPLPPTCAYPPPSPHFGYGPSTATYASALPPSPTSISPSSMAYGAPAFSAPTVSAASFASGPSPASALPFAAPSPVSPASAQVKMARQWEHVYQCTSSYQQP